MSAQKSDVEPPNTVKDQAKRNSLGRCGRMLWQRIPMLPIVILLVVYNIPLTEYSGILGSKDQHEIQDNTRQPPAHVMDDGNASYKIDFPLDHDAETSPNSRTLLNMASYEYTDPKASVTAELLTVVANMKPIDLTTMTIFQGEGGKKYATVNAPKLLPGLTAWQDAFEPVHKFAVGNFRIFLRANNLDIKNGEPYYVLDSNYKGKMPHMNNYHPPTTHSQSEAFLYALLSMFHPNAFINCRHSPRGTMAVIRAENEMYYDILIRAHAEYQLNEYPDFPFWFNPNQFQGRLIISKDASHIEYFDMSIITNRSLNIGMEWITGKNTNEVNIGFMPEMRLYAPVPSEPLTEEYSTPVEQQKYNFDQFDWDFEIPVDEGYSRIEKKMYPFKEIPYLDYLDAFEVAKRDNKLVHFIMLWGTLDDQSC